MERKQVGTVMLEDILSEWHKKHYKDQNLYYIFGFFVSREAREMIEDIGYEFPQGAPFFYVLPDGEQEKKVIESLKYKFAAKLPSFTSDELERNGK